jgi:hypothetical protein
MACDIARQGERGCLDGIPARVFLESERILGGRMTDGNGDKENQRVTNAMLKKDIDYLIKEVGEYHADDVKWRDLMEQRMRELEIFKTSAIVQITILQNEDKEISEVVKEGFKATNGEINDIKNKNSWREWGAYIVAIVAGVISGIVGTSK